ncbi:MAG: ATP-binding protein [Caldilineaceae bacterium]
MYTFDLKFVLFGLLLLLGAVVLATIGIMQRLERRRRTLAALAALQPVLLHAPIAVVVLDRASALRYANPAACRLLAIDPNAPALPTADWVTQLRVDHQELHRIEGQTGRYRMEQVTTATEQVVTVRWWVTQWHEFTLLFATDITAQQQAEQSAQVLLSDLAHELRTPLATLLTHLEVLRLTALSTEMREQSVAFMKEEVQRLVRLSNNLVELGRLEANVHPALQTVDLVTLVESVVAQAQVEVTTRQMVLKLAIQAPLAPVLGNPDRLRQVFLNLIENALKYGAPGVTITLTLEHRAAGIDCAICDTGPGIPAVHLPHLTRRFYRAAPAGVAGSGLGLALVAEILRQHQSHLSIKSQTEGETTGTCVYFTLPPALPSHPLAEGDRKA